MWVEAALHGHSWRNGWRDRALAGRFEIAALVSHGTTASVYRGWDRLAHQPAAIKLLREGVVDDPCNVARFEAEASLLGRLKHPNLLPVVGAGKTEHGQPWFATAWASRGSLADQMVRRGRLRTDEAIRCTLQVLRGLDYLHGLGVVHRDVQPENLLVGDDDVVMLGDFGRASTPDGPSPLSCRASFPPLEAQDGVAADLFGVGATLFGVLTGQSPIALRVETIRHAALAALPGGVARVVDRGTQICPEDRYPSASAMARDLAQIVGWSMGL